MSILRVTPDSTRQDLEEAIGHLRARLASTDDADVRQELADSVDELLDWWAGAGV